MVSCYRLTAFQQKQSGNMLLLHIVGQNPKSSKKEGQRGEELVTNKQVYSWSQNVNGMRV